MLALLTPGVVDANYRQRCFIQVAIYPAVPVLVFNFQPMLLTGVALCICECFRNLEKK